LGSAPDSKRLLFCTSPIFQNLEVSKSGPFWTLGIQKSGNACHRFEWGPHPESVSVSAYRWFLNPQGSKLGYRANNNRTKDEVEF
jgi:hypothetical protein